MFCSNKSHILDYEAKSQGQGLFSDCIIFNLCTVCCFLIPYLFFYIICSINFTNVNCENLSKRMSEVTTLVIETWLHNLWVLGWGDTGCIICDKTTEDDERMFSTFFLLKIHRLLCQLMMVHRFQSQLDLVFNIFLANRYQRKQR